MRPKRDQENCNKAISEAGIVGTKGNPRRGDYIIKYNQSWENKKKKEERSRGQRREREREREREYTGTTLCK
jgi:hypothetical protein